MAYFLKCPARTRLSVSKETTHPSLILEEVLDTTLSYLFVKETANMRPTIGSVLKHAKDLIIEKLPPMYQESYSADAEKILTGFFNNLQDFKSKNELCFPPFEMDLSLHGVTLKLLVNIGIKKKTTGLPITRYIVFDYAKSTGKDSWNIYPRLWAAAIKMLLQEQGITTIETGVLNIPTGKYLPIKYSTMGRVNEMISDACLAIATHMEYPIFGGHCHTCIVKEQCAMAASI